MSLNTNEHEEFAIGESSSRDDDHEVSTAARQRIHLPQARKNHESAQSTSAKPYASELRQPGPQSWPRYRGSLLAIDRNQGIPVPDYNVLFLMDLAEAQRDLTRIYRHLKLDGSDVDDDQSSRYSLPWDDKDGASLKDFRACLDRYGKFVALQTEPGVFLT